MGPTGFVCYTDFERPLRGAGGDSSWWWHRDELGKKVRDEESNVRVTGMCVIFRALVP